MDRQKFHAAPTPMHLKIRNADDDTAPPRAGSRRSNARDRTFSYYPKRKFLLSQMETPIGLIQNE